MASRAENVETNRRSPRRVYNRAIGVLRDGKYEIAQGIQISESGMAFATPMPLEMGARVVVSLMVPGGDGIVLRGFVVGNRDPLGKLHAYGIQFATLDLHERRLIRSYVSAKTQAEAEEEQ